jgi:ABC-type Mn2+/Zn2+ transport system ATPase subunit
MVLIHNPKVLFLDEPFEGIDRVTSLNIKDLLVMVAFYFPPSLYEIVRAISFMTYKNSFK